jgi:hypothetical protein
MNYLALLEKLGPLPRFSEVADFLGEHSTKVCWLVSLNKLEAIETRNGKRRIVLNSLAEYLERLERQCSQEGRWPLERQLERYRELTAEGAK